MLKVLCVDDDPVSILLYKGLLKSVSFSQDVVTAANGEEALDLYTRLLAPSLNTDKDDYPTIVFLDLNMPILSGWDFLDEFMKLYYRHFISTKVIIVSSSVMPEDREKAKTYPVVIDFFSKPITKRMLTDILQKLN